MAVDREKNDLLSHQRFLLYARNELWPLTQSFTFLYEEAMAPADTRTDWSVNYDTVRRERLFRHPPADHTAYPMLAATIRPHVDSFNALFGGIRTLESALQDIGTKTFLDGEAETAALRRARDAAGEPAPRRNRLSVRITEVFLEKAMLSASNKFSTRNREIFPAECRERHATYRGKLRARLEYRVNNGEWKESVRELGQVPIMLRVSHCDCNLSVSQVANGCSRTAATSRICLLPS